MVKNINFFILLYIKILLKYVWFKLLLMLCWYNKLKKIVKMLNRDFNCKIYIFEDVKCWFSMSCDK